MCLQDIMENEVMTFCHVPNVIIFYEQKELRNAIKGNKKKIKGSKLGR